MLPLVLSSAMSFAFPDAGRVEVEGMVITAVAKPSPFGGLRPGVGAECELEFTVSAKAGGVMPICQFDGSIRVLSSEGKLLSTPSKFGPGMSPRSLGGDRWTVRLNFEEAPPKKLPAVEGTISIAPSQRKVVTFEGAALKLNSVVAMDGGSVKLTVLDVDDGQLDLRFRLTMPQSQSKETPIRGASATLIDVHGQEVKMTSQGFGLRSDGKTVNHILRFRSDANVKTDALRTLRLEVPMPNAPAKKVSFRISDVPVDESKTQRKAGR